MMSYITISDIVLIFTVYIFKTSNIETLSIYKYLMYGNLLFPALMCNAMCVLITPFIIAPFPVICCLGPFRFGLETTLLYYDVMFWGIMLGSLNILYTICLNYISVCHAQLLYSPYFRTIKPSAVLLPLGALTGASVIIPYLILSDTTSIPTLIAMDSRNIFLKKYAALVINLPWNGGFEACLFAILVMYVGASAIAAVLIFRVLARIRAKKHEFSRKTLQLHLSVVRSLMFYCILLFVQLGLPAFLYSFTEYFKLTWINGVYVSFSFS
ncbi:hypothetical protein Y032_0534g3072 [Ancylostoma ceylanicum]|uniref:Uncharacterized protein n=3 Tax=Ancylostoma ceylanicum TaxID=53326 RepID=A0A016WSX6_9BILA|nr:hypothetical protein Y032_0534g3072 [Ancylostoma ceylanicum]